MRKNEIPGMLVAVAITFNAFAQECYQATSMIVAPNPELLAQFGERMSLHEDVLVVASRAEGVSASVYRNVAGAWTHEADLVPSHPMQAVYGVPVAGDDFVALGVPHDGFIAPNDGSVYIFNQNAGVWTETAVLRPPSGHDVAFFGSSIAVKGDLLAVNAGRPDEYIAYIYHRDGVNWNLVDQIPSPLASGELQSTALIFAGDELVISGDVVDARTIPALRCSFMQWTAARGHRFLRRTTPRGVLPGRCPM